MSEDISPQHAAGGTPQERLENAVSAERTTGPPHEPAALRNGVPSVRSGDTRSFGSADDRVRGAEVPSAASATNVMPAPAGTTKRKRWKLTPQSAVVIAAVIALIGTLAGVLIPKLWPQTPVPAATNSATPATRTNSATSATRTNSATSATRPPSASVVTVLMAEEAAGAVAHRPADAIRLYVPTAFVRDDACGKPSHSQMWSGQHRILQRYQHLGAFAWLKHQNAEVSFNPDNAQATSATAHAQTAGFIDPSAASPAGQEIHGNEVWTFIRVNGKWLISSFIYNVC